MECGQRPLILLRDNRGGTRLDFVTGRDGEWLALASGGGISARGVIAPTALGIPGVMPYWGGPGRGLWEAVAAKLSASVWEQVSIHPGRTLTREQSGQLLSELFKEAGQGGLVVAGSPIPLNPQAARVPLDSSLLAFLDLDFVTEQAWPKPGCGAAVEPYIMVRVFTGAEWRALAGDRSAASPSGNSLPQDTSASALPTKGPKRQSEAKVAREFAALLRQRGTDNEPTQRESDDWAKAKNFPRPLVRRLHNELVGRPRGRPCKHKSSAQGNAPR